METAMKPGIAATLRDRLSEDAAREPNEFVDQQGREWRSNVVDTCTDRIDGRLRDYAMRDDVAKGFERIVDKLADVRVELLRWSFAFWVGQVAIVLAAMFAIAKLI